MNTAQVTEQILQIPHILVNIFSYLPRKELKHVTCSSRYFKQLSAPLLWEEPHFEYEIGQDDLEAMLELELPIQKLKLSQLWFVERMWSEFEEMVNLLARFNLKQFICDDYDDYDEYDFMPSSENLTYLVESLNCCATDVIVHTNSYFNVGSSADEFISLLASYSRCPKIVITRGFHERLSLDNLRSLVRLPLVEVQVSFRSLGGGLRMDQLDEYVTIMKLITASPKFHLSSPRCPFTPDGLRTFATDLKISSLRLDSFDFDSADLDEFLDVLEETNQRPSFKFKRWMDMDVLSFERILKRFHVSEMDTANFPVDCSVDELISTMKQHKRSFKNGILKVSFKKSSRFTEEHLKEFQSLGWKMVFY